MIYRPDSFIERYKLYKKYEGIFSNKRWLNLPHRIFLCWIECKELHSLREPTANPVLFDRDMKSDFYFLEYVH